MTPVDVMAAIAAVLIAASVVFVMHALFRRRRSLRQRTRRDRSEVDRETPGRTKPKA